MTHRMLLLAGLCEGESVIENVELSDDVAATVGCLRAIGADVTNPTKTSVKVRGVDIKSIRPSSVFDCRECGSTLRFFIPVCMVSGAPAELTGSPRLLQRPLGAYEKIAREQNIGFSVNEKSVNFKGPLHGGTFELPGDVSSQFVSGLLFVLPLLEDKSVIRLTGKVESRPYIDMTLDAIKRFGGEARWISDRELLIPGRQTYHPVNALIEGDWSNAAPFFAMQYYGWDVDVKGLDTDSKQGDRVITDHLLNLSSKNEPVDLSDAPDLGPVEFAFAALKYGGRFTGVRRLRFKESDRVAAMADELRKFGCSMSCSVNDVRIGECDIRTPDCVLDGHNDHRIVMALSFLCCFTGGAIDGAEAVNKSFPGFFKELEKLKVRITYEA
ncbi:MAG: 3-phosphoshikimate 1-carboxyvinyltransferase [Clostridia bacterium]|nr:3-phosphoshikimate 1-carboxyvinyltransferase [Clostridia bacterium]